MNNLILKANYDNLEKLLDFVRECGENINCDEPTMLDFILATEEILVNIISYAYPFSENGMVEIKFTSDIDKNFMTLDLVDEGIPFNSLTVEEPDINLPLEERKIGGMGIFLVKKVTDDMKYKREKGKNILTLVKRICRNEKT